VPLAAESATWSVFASVKVRLRVAGGTTAAGTFTGTDAMVAGTAAGVVWMAQSAAAVTGCFSRRTMGSALAVTVVTWPGVRRLAPTPAAGGPAVQDAKMSIVDAGPADGITGSTMTNGGFDLAMASITGRMRAAFGAGAAAGITATTAGIGAMGAGGAATPTAAKVSVAQIWDPGGSGVSRRTVRFPAAVAVLRIPVFSSEAPAAGGHLAKISTVAVTPAAKGAGMVKVMAVTVPEAST